MLLAQYPARNLLVVALPLQAIGSALISAATIRLLFEVLGREDLANTFTILDDQSKTGIRRVVCPVQSFTWLTEIELARSIKIAGLRLSFVENPAYLDAFEKVLAGGGDVTLVMSDPRSAAMLLRYHEEPHSPPWGSDIYGWNNGLQQLSDLLAKLWEWHTSLVAQKRDISRLSIKVFPHYPGHAYYAFDDKVYVYHYPFNIRGFNGPLFMFALESTVGRFYARCLRTVIDASRPLGEVIDDIMSKAKIGVFSDAHVLSVMPSQTPDAT